MRSRRRRSIQSGLPESAHGSPELVKHALLVEVDGMSRKSKWSGSESRASDRRVGPLPSGRVVVSSAYRRLRPPAAPSGP